MLANRGLRLAATRTASPISQLALAPLRSARVLSSTPVSRATTGGVNDPDAGKPTLNVDSYARSIRLGRPRSPHLSIYKVQLSMALSALHRITGVGLSGAFVLGSAYYGLAPFASADVINFVQSLPAPVLIASKIIIAAPLVFHSLNGCRHLLWDTGRQLHLKGVYNTGYTVLFATALGTLYLALQ
ncbi:succinate dehydrogenase cytochrome b560 subunit [Fimicolochytrium jonesii]|uniref:succinate dehydrogenase cytochrome b560 subunit n=1 Tax=Fimicolochytrium jonesii TaxID=1396493 RepID=UPI0022FE4B1B|nr:succinate dehydrogenase cytochrome b560 subunit [Fimicolochytrium jonesii]KAI8819387.1 succinate dehydrogenase cytochrome b560 subunit [Fimicolochytrium jonesii]